MSSVEDHAAMIERQMQTMRDAQDRKGEKAKNKPSRLMLEMKFNEQGCFTHPPSTTSLVDLEPIDISSLRLETHHLGKVLVVRTFGHPTRIQAVQNAVEDGYGGVDRLAVYNEDPAMTPGQILPKGLIFAIKEPFYKGTADGGFTIRVDHPSDLVRLSPADPSVPKAFRIAVNLTASHDATQWKTMGNDAFRRKDYIEAQNMYSKGIMAIEAIRAVSSMGSPIEARVSYLTVEDAAGSSTIAGASHALSTTLKRDLYRNRAIVHISLQKYEAALEDAIASVIPEPDAEGRKQNTKAWFRAGRASYELRQFGQAAEYFKMALQMTRDDADSVREFARALRRQQESMTGHYDFPLIYASTNNTHKRLDHASFIENVIVSDSPDRGRGLFATKDFKAGELIFCEKAFSIAFASDISEDWYTIINLNTNRGHEGPHASLFFSLIQQLRRNPKQATRFFDLYDGDYQPKCKASAVDGNIVVDTFQTQAIVEHNAFSCAGVKSADKMVRVKLEREKGPSNSGGIWLLASRVNHACDGNARRAFIGDLMVVRAVKDIAEGEEIFMPYSAPGPDNEGFVTKLHDSWGFWCACAICTAETGTSARQRHERKELLHEMGEFLETHSHCQEYLPSKSIIAKAEQLYQQLEKTYGKAFSMTPTRSTNQKAPSSSAPIVARPGLHDLSQWLAQAYSTPSTPQKSIDWALAMLRDLGYLAQVKKNKLSIDRRGACPMPAVAHAAMHAAHAYFFRGQIAVGKQFVEFAMEIWRTFFVALDGFQENFGTTHKQFM